MFQNYDAEIEYPDGTIKKQILRIGGGSMTPEALKEWLIRHNKYPGAKEVRLSPQIADRKLMSEIISRIPGANIDEISKPTAFAPATLPPMVRHAAPMSPLPTNITNRDLEQLATPSEKP